mmetsp:Transcript_18780/g.38525  ORF Transcript_18780/g.38525 Transcript_18780/m.38525 type:complete len:463 (+) Transcript_18780:120-1508(+)
MMIQEQQSSLLDLESGLGVRHVEVAVASLMSQSLQSDLRSRLERWLESQKQEIPLGKSGDIDISALPNETGFPQTNMILKARVADDNDDLGCSSPTTSSLSGCSFRVHTYELSQEEISVEEIEPSGGDDEWTAACDSLPLPHVSLDGLWENLYFDSKVKRELLEYAQSGILFGERQVSQHIIHWNRILLLHGVPGTGKTSLCRALAHKLAIRLSDRFHRSTLLEIKSHSLFSKWFSTSGKLISTLFSMVRDMVEDDPQCLVCVLIDEVESLASSRSNAGGGDPSDAMRAVNSLLTSLDRLRSFPNVLVLTTTNITGKIDAAFIDRVDLKLHIGLPILRARYEILRGCVEELARAGIVLGPPGTDPCWGVFADFSSTAARKGERIGTDADGDDDDDDISRMLLVCAREAEGLSGRSLRRLPLKAHSQLLSSSRSGGEKGVSTQLFLRALHRTICSEQKSRFEF